MLTQILQHIVTSPTEEVVIYDGTPMYDWIMENVNTDDEDSFLFNLFTPDDNMDLETSKTRLHNTIQYVMNNNTY